MVNLPPLSVVTVPEAADRIANLTASVGVLLRLDR